jgi:hypothetical protein
MQQGYGTPSTIKWVPRKRAGCTKKVGQAFYGERLVFALCGDLRKFGSFEREVIMADVSGMEEKWSRVNCVTRDTTWMAKGKRGYEIELVKEGSFVKDYCLGSIFMIEKQ